MTTEQLEEYRRLMSIPTKEWPDSLFLFVQERCLKYAGCMEVIACAVEDWLKMAEAERPTQRWKR